ncbi:GAF domain-containing sensor histidine kinase [Longimicrobium sp.]|jgi:two-component system sensor histidine kinase EvgS|uniref:sensor histidine kinase n=1 Tax=Longimicrobium sp. TaxID=2029185 RepID=UPI002EDA442D
MDFHFAALQACASDDPTSAFAAAVGAFDPPEALFCAAWAEADGTLVAAHPDATPFSAELLELAARAVRAEVFPLRSLSPVLAARFPDAELLLLPVSAGQEGRGGVLLVAREGALGDDPSSWAVVGAALARTAARAEVLLSTQRECSRLRTRAEEIEALDVLGLAANRTLDPDEVVSLVARFSRTLLGADYVAVITGEAGLPGERSGIGLRGDEPWPADEPLAASVVRSGKPVYVGQADSPRVEQFPFHAAQGMQAGLGVPLSLFGETFGALIVGYRAPYGVTRQDTRLAVTLARNAAVAISNARLHRAVASRSRELEAAYAQLSELSRVKERFFATMSHELRTPINAVKGYSDLLLDGLGGELMPQARRYVEHSRTAALSLLSLINDLLDFAKIEAGKMEVARDPVSVREMVSQSVAVVEPMARQKGLRVDTGPLEGLPILHTDRKRVVQVLTNLLSNAVKFTDAGSVTVSARHLAEEAEEHGASEPRWWLELRVADTGRGIAPGDLDRVFAEYEQVAGSDGTGLGLPISRKLARLLGGELSVESDLGVGSTFVLRVPAPPPRAVPQPATARPLSVPHPASP